MRTHNEPSKSDIVCQMCVMAVESADKFCEQIWMRQPGGFRFYGDLLLEIVEIEIEAVLN